MCFDDVNKVSAMRYFQSSDVSHLKNGKARLSKIGYVMKKLEVKAKDLPEWAGHQVSADGAKQMFDQVY